MGWKQNFLNGLKQVGKETGKAALQSAVTAAQVNPYASILATVLTTAANKNLPLDATAMATLEAFGVELTPEEFQVFVLVVSKMSKARLSSPL
ncbi:MAG: hypothetical protein ACRD2L_21955 [Terriglobia bacterium]